MQYPTQSQTGRQSTPPAEVNQQEQSQIGEPALEQLTRQRLAIYANPIQAARSMTSMTNSMIVRILFLIPVSFLILDFARNAAPDSAATFFLLAVLVLFNVLVIARAILDHWLTGRSLLANPEPLLQFTSEGLRVRGPSWPTPIVLAWSEIESIDVYHYKFHYLCVRPRNPQLTFERFPRRERLLNYGNALLYGASPLTFSQAYLDRPVEEILQQLYSIYAQELNSYQIQIRS